MKQRSIHASPCIGILILALSITPAFSSRLSAAPEPTNFIQILTDDQGWGDLASFGHPFIQSPHIDKLGRDGIKFMHCYAAASVCSPSRSAILTGRTPYRNGVFRWIPANHFCHLPASETTLPQLLRKKGYATAHFGKWHLSHFSEDLKNDIFRYGENPDQPSMDEYGYDYYFAGGNVARPCHKDPVNFFLNGKAMGPMKGYSATLVAEAFATWFKEHRKPDQPFFATIWFQEPHGPIETNPDFMTGYGKLKDESLKQYFGNITQIDDAVGRIVEAIDEAGATDNTLIWYTSDNGPEGIHDYGDFNRSNSYKGRSRMHGSTGGLRGRKRFTHEGGIRVPGIVKWPAGLRKAGVRTGSLSAEPIIGSDIFPTFLEIAGIELPGDRVYDGQSILPLLEGKPFVRLRPLYWRNSLKEQRIALRDGDWKIIANSQRTAFELYNLRVDHRETTDLSAHEPKRFEAMKKALIAYDQEVLEEGPDWWKKEEKIANTMPAAH